MRINRQFLKHMLISVIVLLGYLPVFLPTQTLIINITTVILIGVFYILICGFKIHYSAIILLLISISMILFTFDPSKISILVFLLLLLIFEKVNRNMIITFLITSLMLYSLVVFLYLVFGFNNQYDSRFWRPIVGYDYRYSLGFTQPNQTMIKFLVIAISSLVIVKSKKVISILILIITYILFTFTASRTASVILAVVVLFYLLISERVLLTKRFNVFAKYMFIIGLIFSYYLSVSFNNTFIDDLLTGRLRINYYFISTYDLSLLGHEIGDTVFDNAFLHMLVTNGILFTILYSYYFSRIFKSKSLSVDQIIVLFCFMSIAFMEVILLKIDLLLLMILIFRQEPYHVMKHKKSNSYLQSIGNYELSNGEGESL